MPLAFDVLGTQTANQILSSNWGESRTTSGVKFQPVGRCGATERRASLEARTH